MGTPYHASRMLVLLKLWDCDAKVSFKITFASLGDPSGKKNACTYQLTPDISVLQSQTSLPHDAQGQTCFKHMFYMVQSIMMQLITLIVGIQ